MIRLVGCAVLLPLLILGAGIVGAITLSAGLGAAAGFQRPVPGAMLTQGFGCTWLAMEPADPHCPGGHWHSGVDLAAARGTAVLATESGVATVFRSSGGYGLRVVIDHGDGLTSLYGHLDSVSVGSGATVSAGEVIGALGSTGNSTGPHLHFEIRRDGIAEDPREDLALP